MQIIRTTGWTFEELDQADIEQLFPFYFELLHEQTGSPRAASGPRRLYADQAGFLPGF